MPGTPTTKYAIPTFNAGGTDPVNTGHTQINNALTAIDGAFSGYATGTFAGKPAAGKAGRLYLCTDTGQWLADTGSAWVDLNSAPAFVSSLPAGYDGQEVYYQADLTNGVIWHLRYRSASASAYKWEMVGGSSLMADIPTQETTSSTAFTDLTTVGPSITVPLAGDYEIVFGSGINASTNGFAAPKIGAAAVSTNDDIVQSVSAGTASGNGSRPLRRNVPAAATVVKVQYAAAAATTVAFFNRSLSIRPIRVG